MGSKSYSLKDTGFKIKANFKHFVHLCRLRACWLPSPTGTSPESEESVGVGLELSGFIIFLSIYCLIQSKLELDMP